MNPYLPEGVVPEVSVVIPCLNEARTLAICIRKAQEGLTASEAVGEIIVADNGSDDESRQIAEQLGATVVLAAERGYGAALQVGISRSRGRFIIMGDADNSYDFREIPRFLAALRQGIGLAQGCRFPRRGGRIRRGAMPFLHRWLGNPGLTMLAHGLYGTGVADVYCGLRGFSREAYRRLGMTSTGMEFALEMVVRSALENISVCEIPITLHPDGRQRAPHLKTFRDGFRGLNLLLSLLPIRALQFRSRRPV